MSPARDDLERLHRRLVAGMLTVVAIALPFIAQRWPERVPPPAAAVLGAALVIGLVAHAHGRVSTAAATRLLVLGVGALVLCGSLLAVLTSPVPAQAWSHEAHHLGRALTLTTGALYVTLGRRAGRRAAVAVAVASSALALALFEGRGVLAANSAEALTPLLDVLASGLLAGILFDVAASNARHLAKGRRTAARMAQLDALTGVNNRHGITPAIHGVLDRPGEAALVMLDLDHFKSINDRHGHADGDRILREVGEVLVDHTRDADVVGRWGGEEFVVVVTEGGPTVALRVAERIRLALHRIRADMPVSGSLGVALVQPGDTAETLLERADRALYRAKRRGRDRVVPAWPHADRLGGGEHVIDLTDAERTRPGGSRVRRAAG